MSAFLRFKHHFHCEVFAPHGVLLLSERGQFMLRGAAYVHVAPLLDGLLTAEEIAARLDGTVPAAEVFYALGLLKKKGYVVEDLAPARTAASAFWEALGATS